MRTILLHIKGNNEQAEQALLKHGFDPSERLSHPVTTHDTSGIIGYHTTNVTVKSKHELAVQRWFAETTDNFDPVPFPPGTLLHYTVTR